MSVGDVKRVLVVAAHPDDEVLGCGGTLARHACQGDEVHILVLADGVTAREDGEQQLESRRGAAFASARVLGAHRIVLLSLPDNRMDTCDLIDVVRAVEATVSEVQPHVVYTHHHGDLNIDHRIAHGATVTACRPTGNCTVELLAAFEVLSSTDWATPVAGNAFLANHFVDVSETFAAKIAALECYKDEMRPFPHPRSERAVTALAELRGASIGVERAEAFEIIRHIAGFGAGS